MMLLAVRLVASGQVLFFVFTIILIVLSHNT